MIPRCLRWVTADGLYLFQVPEEDWLIDKDTVVLLSSSLYALSVYLAKGQLKFNGENLAVVRMTFHPPIPKEGTIDIPDEEHYVIHIAYENGLCIHSLFRQKDISKNKSEFETAFLESVAQNIVENLHKKNRNVSDIPFLRDQHFIHEIEQMFKEIDKKYSSLASDWTLAQGVEEQDKRFSFTNVRYNGKIRVENMLYDLGERAIESFDSLLLSKEEKITLYKMAKSLISQASIMYQGADTKEESYVNQLNFAQTEIIFESQQTNQLYRLDVRSYDIEGDQMCDITVMD
ncbi:MAG: hypothetical protein U9O98_11165 [Asgard group archaeon]|nr:hypothetical protein [Asgard group archaeon]